MPQPVAGHPDYPVARHLQFDVASAVVLERVDARVVRSAVQLDHHFVVGPGGVDAETGNHDVEPWRWDLTLAAEGDELVLQWQPCTVHLG